MILDQFWWISGYIFSECWSLIARARMRLLNDVQIATCSMTCKSQKPQKTKVKYRFFKGASLYSDKQQKSVSQTLLTTRCVLEAICSRFGTDFGPSGEPFGASWGLLGAAWAALGASWAPLGRILGALGALLDALGALLDALGALKRRQEAAKRPQEALRGAQEAPRGSQRVPERVQNSFKTAPQSVQSRDRIEASA